jgi:RHS repeat-associated protein
MNYCRFKSEEASTLVGDPINVITGANIDVKLDFQMPGPIPLMWVRHYDSSKNLQRLALGWGHTHGYDHWLQFDVDGMRYSAPLGPVVGFPPLVRDGQRFARGGYVLNRHSPQRYFLHRTGEPSMVFEFRDSSRTPLARLTQGKSSLAFRYDRHNRLESILDSRGQTIGVTTDDAGQILSLVLEQPNRPRPLMDYRYDAAANLEEGIDPYRNSFRFQFDANHRVVERTDCRGYSFRFEYDKKGRCVHSYGEDGLHATRLEYHTPEGVTLVTKADGGLWTFLCPEGKLIRIIDPYGGAREFKRDASGRTIEETDSNGNVSRMVYDSAGGLSGKLSPLGILTRGGEDQDQSNPSRRQLPNGPLEWEFGTLYQRLRGREKLELPSPGDAALRKLPDGMGKYVRTRDPETPADGRVYDTFGKLIREGGPEGSSRRRLYDSNGNLHRITDRDGSQYTYEHSSWNLRTEFVDPLGAAVTLKHTATEKLSSLTDRGGAVSEYEYDLKDRLIRIRRHNLVKEEYRYDAADNLIEKLDGEKQPLLTFEIGPGNLRKTRQLASGGVHAFEYDKKGRMLSAATDDAAVVFAYDEFGQRVKDERNGLGVAHGYAGASQLAQITYLGRFTVQYKRDRNGTMTVLDPRGREHKIEALGCGLLLRKTANGSSELAQFDSEGRCLAKAAERHGNVWARRYFYSGEGDLLSVQDNFRGLTKYRCDAAHRLNRADLPDGHAQDFAYDSAGNLLRQPGLEGVVLRDGNRLLEANGDRFEYNLRNHISARINHAGSTRYFYDSVDMLSGCESRDTQWEAHYDALSRRISKTWLGRRTEFYWDGDRLAAEVRGDGGLRIYIYADHFAMTPFLFLEYAAMDADPKSGQGYYVYGDHLSSPLLVEDDFGKTVWEARLNAYGTAHVDSKSTIEMPLRFPGHYFDSETGLHFNRYRYYSPELGRYLQSDPVGIGGGPNLYAYTTNPLKRVDVLGLGCPAGGSGKGPPTDNDDQEENEFDDEPTIRTWAPPDPDLAEACGPLQKPWLIRDGEGTLPDSAREARPGSPMVLDPNVSTRYMYVTLEDGTIVYAPQEFDITGDEPVETVKHTDLAQNGPARVSGEINYNADNDQWEMDSQSGRYSAAPVDPDNPNSMLVGTRSDSNVQAASGLANNSGTTANIVPKTSGDD